MSEAFQGAVRQILEAVMFENWLRFYFITDLGEDRLAVAVPEQGLVRIRELHPELMPLVEELNGKEINFELSRSAVCTFVVTELDGQSMPRDMAAVVFDSAAFQLEMRLFNTWVQAHEAQLDETFMDFSSWQSLFTEWRDSDKVKAWAAASAASAEPEGRVQ